MINKISSKNLFFLFLLFHIALWTLVPSISNLNLPLDTIEALAWASNPDWGYNKHPPLSAFVVGVIYEIFKTNDWAYYLLSQIFVIVGFLFVWKLSLSFFSKKIFTFLSVLILETIVFFNYTTPEFNVYVCQIPIKALVIYFFWKSINNNKTLDWLIVGIFSALGVLTHYSFFFLLLSLFIFFLIFGDNQKKKYFTNITISFLVFIIFLTPHLIWLHYNDYITIIYALGRTGIESKNLVSHIYNPLVFLFKQFGMLFLFLLLFFSILSFKKLRIKINFFDKKKLFLICITFLPIFLVLFLSIISGAKIRTMWMSSFYLFFGILFFYYFKDFVSLNKIKRFIFLSLIVFIISPITYLYISLTNDFKRTDYPGEEISQLVQKKWDDNFINDINIVIGDEWSAGNLSYHLKSRPIWTNNLKNELILTNKNQGVIYTGNPKILKRVCPGVFGTIKPVGYCMIGQK